MGLSNWARNKALEWLCVNSTNKIENHTHINFAAEVCKISNDLNLGKDDILVLMTDQVLGDTLIKKLKWDMAAVLGPRMNKIAFLQGGLKMGVIHQKDVGVLEEIQ